MDIGPYCSTQNVDSERNIKRYLHVENHSSHLEWLLNKLVDGCYCSFERQVVKSGGALDWQYDMV